jgi:hypothetical protein
MKYILPFLLFLVSCLQDSSSPESVLRNFVEARMGHTVTREFILERVTGKMKQSLEHISDEEFAKFADLRNVKKDSFKILSKSCQEKRCFITYSVAYQTVDNEKTSFVSEVKKIAEVILEEGKWLISDVSNIKTYHEALEPINPLD